MVVVPAVFLYFWKCISVILGDSTKDKDHKTRYKELGFSDDFYQTDVRKVTKLRHNYDVAHYSLSAKRKDEVTRNYGLAQGTAAKVIRHYREYLLEQAT